MVVVDTSVIVDFLNGVTNPETEWLDLALDRQRLCLTTVTVAEVLMGISSEREAANVDAQLREFEIVHTLDADAAVDAARYYRRLRKEGRTVRKTIDLLIATHCIRHDRPLLHRDRDFDVFEERLGLRVIHP